MAKVSTEMDRMKTAFKQKDGETFGRVKKYAPKPNQGGPVIDQQGSPVKDTVNAKLAHGEYVLPADTVEQVGVENLEELRAQTHQPIEEQKAQFGMNNGGMVGQAAGQIRNRRSRIDAAVEGEPAPASPAPEVKTIPQQTEEKIVKPATGVVSKVKKVFGFADGGLATAALRGAKMAVATPPVAALTAAMHSPGAQAQSLPEGVGPRGPNVGMAFQMHSDAAKAAIMNELNARGTSPERREQLKASILSGPPADPRIINNAAVNVAGDSAAVNWSGKLGRVLGGMAGGATAVAARQPRYIEELGRTGAEIGERAGQDAGRMLRGFGDGGRVGMFNGGWVYNNGRIDEAASNAGGRARERIIAGNERQDTPKPQQMFDPAVGNALEATAPGPQPSVFGRGGSALQTTQAAWDSMQNSRVSAADLSSLNRFGSSRPALSSYSSMGGQVREDGRLGFVEGGLLEDKRPRLPRPPTYPVAQLPVETIDYSKTPNPTNLGNTVSKFGTQPAQPVDPRRAADLVNNRPAPPASPKQPGMFGRAWNNTKAVGRGVRTVAKHALGPYAAGAAAALHSEDVGAGSDIVEGAPRPGAFDVTPEAAALSDQDKTRLMNELNNPRTDPGRQAQIRELMIGKNPTAASSAPVSRFGQVPPTPTTPTSMDPNGTRMGPPEPALSGPTSSALARMGISVEDQGQPGPASADARRDLVQNARPAPGQQVALGDYGVKGQAIFGAASKPGEVEQYKADLARYGKLGPMPDVHRDPRGYAAYQLAAGNYDRTQAVAEGSRLEAQGRSQVAQVAAQKAQMDGLFKAVEIQQKANAENRELAAANLKSMDEALDLHAQSGALPGFEGQDPAKLAAHLKAIARTQDIDLGDGRKVKLKDVPMSRFQEALALLLSSARPTDKGVFRSPPSLTSTNNWRPVTEMSTRLNAATASGLDVFNPLTRKYMTNDRGEFQRADRFTDAEIVRFGEPRR